MLAVRNLDTRAVVRSIFAWLGSTLARLGSSRRLFATPLLHDRRQNSPTGMTGLKVNVRSRVRSSLEVLVERSGVAGVEED